MTAALAGPVAAAVAVALASVGGLACGGGSAGGDDGSVVDGGGDLDAGTCAPTDARPPSEIPLRGACPEGVRLGGFEIVETQAYASIVGEVRASVLPQLIPEVVMGEGDCRLLRRSNPFCDPACADDEVCGSDGECSPYPRSLDLGIVELRGLAACFALAARAPGHTYFATDVPNPAAAAGTLVEMVAPDAEIGALELFGLGATPLPAERPAWEVAPGAPLEVRWPAAPRGARSRIAVRVTVDQHGLAPVTIACDTADDGSLEVPLTLVDAMFASGVSGFPSGALVRRTVDSQEVSGGCVELVVASERVAGVTVVR